MALVEVVEARTLGEGWLEVSRRILEHGEPATWDGAETRELALLALAVAEPDPRDERIAALADPEWLEWMHRNFTALDDVPELGGARSYARRLRAYEGHDQVQWVIDRLRANPQARDASITTFQPLADTTYIPCVSLLDFWLPEGRLELIVYAHSLDFGKKAYGNLVELARLQHEVADAVDAGVGRLVIHAKSAHIYAPEYDAMQALV
jgi:thymidylate synthase